MEKIFEHAAGIDIGSEHIFIAVEHQPVKRFDTFTVGLDAAVQYLQGQGVRQAAMEATGIYWCALFDKIEAAGMEACLVNPRKSKSLPGRKSDVQDCEWIRQLYAHGMLTKSFVPKDDIRELRAYVRYREQKIADSSKCVQRMQKALTQMNVRLSNVISNIMGVSGQKIIRAILEGQRDVAVLTALCDKSILRAKKELVESSLRGTYVERHLFELQKELDAYDFYEKQIAECDQKIGQVLAQMEAQGPAYDASQNGKPKPATKVHMPQIDGMHEKIMRCNQNRDGCKLPGIGDYTQLRLLAEVGNDFSKWMDSNHFTAWLGLAPGKNASGKKTKKSPPMAATRASLIFRQAAMALLRSKDCALGAFARRLRAKKGPAIAIKATARKLAVYFYNFMKHGSGFVEKGIEEYEKKYRLQIMNSLKKTIRKFQFDAYELEMIPVQEQVVH
ncbi:MAG: IS110 family transposase [Saprospiraceae bacterium]